MSLNECTPAPASPINGPSDWSTVVRGNCFSNLQRLGLWTGGGTIVPSGTDPSPCFQPVTAGSLGSGAEPPTIYVITHGWAPGYQGVVNNQGGNLLWWGADANIQDSTGNTAWASDWAWSPVTAPVSPALPINTTGMLQSILAFDPNAVALAYSWIDDSATDSGTLNMQEVYGSEAYTHTNGIRLANALQEAIDPSFWQTGQLRLIGHSHGSKVMTVAAFTLQQQGLPVAGLTILDSPESYIPLAANGANLLGFYLEQMQIANPSSGGSAGAFVDSYASCFGVGYAGNSMVENIVETALYPAQLYSDYSNQHTYAATWYGGAAAGAEAVCDPPVGLAWPPAPPQYQPTLNQIWPFGTNETSQWLLYPGDTILTNYNYANQPLSVSTTGMQGNVQGDPSTALVFGPASGPEPAYSLFQGNYSPSSSDQYGIAFDLDWTAPQSGDYLVVTIGGYDTEVYYTLLVIDGQSAPNGTTSVAINTDVWDFSSNIFIYFLGSQANSAGQVTISNFQEIDVTSANSTLGARRKAILGANLQRRL